jgi:hypothetical protein
LGGFLSTITVKKRGGNTENFSINKIKSSLLKAGCLPKEADKISNKIKEWAENQPGKIVHSVEIERKIIDKTKDEHKDTLISFLAHGKSKPRTMDRIFDRRDIAQMLTSLFVIIQVYVLSDERIIGAISYQQATPVLLTSMGTCLVILWLLERDEIWKHFTFGLLLVSLLAMIIGLILEV